MKILAIDDEKNILEVIKIMFEKDGHIVFTALRGYEGIGKIKSNLCDIVISDIRLPDISGINVLKEIKNIDKTIPVIMITAYASTSSAVQAMKFGAEDYVVKPFDIDELRMVVENVYEKRKLQIENRRLRQQIEEKYSFGNMVGKSKSMKDIFMLIRKVAPLDSTVLITGESGTGKDLIAKSIHYQSRRKDNNFVSINCASIPETLLESELFGFKRGAFTGAVNDSKGLFKEANKGTLFLDEIGEMPVSLQAKLLRALQDKKIRPLGSSEETDVDVRIIAASNHNLRKRIKKGYFREDLFYRLNVISIEIPPLRERQEDIPLLLNHFISEYNKKLNKNIEGIEKEVLDLFYNYDWPGNVREMEHLIERMLILEEGDKLTTENLPSHFKEKLTQKTEDIPLIKDNNFNLEDYIDNLKSKIIKKALTQTKGNKKKAAKILGISYRSFRYYFNKYQRL